MMTIIRRYETYMGPAKEDSVKPGEGVNWHQVLYVGEQNGSVCSAVNSVNINFSDDFVLSGGMESV